MNRLFDFKRIMIMLAVGLTLAGCGTTPEAATATAQALITPSAEPTTPPPLILKVALGRAPQTIDPALVGPNDMPGNDLVANLFSGLVTLNGDTGEIGPGIANRWQTTDSIVWTVTLRTDVPWVQINPNTSQLEQKRIVNAGDVVATLQRACQHATGSVYIKALSLIKNCADVYSRPASEVTQSRLDDIGVKAIDDNTVQFTLKEAAGYFPSIMATPAFIPLPADLLASAGANWTQPDTLWTSGAFTLLPSVPVEQGYQLIKNPAWPFERTGNVDGVQVTFDADSKASYSAWENGELALTLVPASELASAPFDSDPRYRLLAKSAEVVMAISYDTAPMDNADVRRALALATDREAILKQAVLANTESGLTITSLIPPGSAEAPAYGTVGVKTDVAAAQAAMAKAGYAKCARLPQITILVDDQPLSKAVGKALVDQWTAAFGCPVGVFQTAVGPFQNVQIAMRTPPTDIRQPRRAGVILLAWQADYPAAHHWLADILGCREKYPLAYLNQARPCSEIDARIGQAGASTDPRSRAAAYESIERSLFDADGEMPLIPLFVYTRAIAAQPWLEVHPLRAGPLRFDQWVVTR